MTNFNLKKIYLNDIRPSIFLGLRLFARHLINDPKAERPNLRPMKFQESVFSELPKNGPAPADLRRESQCTKKNFKNSNFKISKKIQKLDHLDE